MTTPESRMRDRLLFSDNRNPSASDLLAQGYSITCFCGTVLKTWTEFVEHDKRTEAYYKRHLSRFRYPYIYNKVPDMVAETHIRIDRETLALLRKRAGIYSAPAALRKLLGLPPTGTKRGPKPGWKKALKT